MATTDLTIQGAGIFGLSIAWEAIKRGARVRVIDPNGVGSGASGGIVGALQPHTPDHWNTKKQFQLDGLLMARELWPEVEMISGIDSGFSNTGRLQPLSSTREIARARSRISEAKENWGDHAEWDVIDATDAGDWAPPSSSGFLIRDTLSAVINPRRALEGLASAIKTRGGEILTAGEILGPVVWATGWEGLIDLETALKQSVGSGEKGQAALLSHSAPGHPQVFADGLHIIPHMDGTVAVGSTSERNFDDAKFVDHQVDALIERAGEIMPLLKGARVIERWAGIRPRATSRAPVLGNWPGRTGHYVANGGFKIGFGVAPKVATTMVDLILEGRDTIPQQFRLQAS